MLAWATPHRRALLTASLAMPAPAPAAFVQERGVQLLVGFATDGKIMLIAVSAQAPGRGAPEAQGDIHGRRRRHRQPDGARADLAGMEAEASAIPALRQLELDLVDRQLNELVDALVERVPAVMVRDRIAGLRARTSLMVARARASAPGFRCHGHAGKRVSFSDNDNCHRHRNADFALPR